MFIKNMSVAKLLSFTINAIKRAMTFHFNFMFSLSSLPFHRWHHCTIMYNLNCQYLFSTLSNLQTHRCPCIFNVKLVSSCERSNPHGSVWIPAQVYTAWVVVYRRNLLSENVPSPPRTPYMRRSGNSGHSGHGTRLVQNRVTKTTFIRIPSLNRNGGW